MKGNFTQRDYLLSLLRALSESFGPSGFEDAVRERVVKEVESASPSPRGGPPDYIPTIPMF